ncbi:hypothetical protein BDV96DRAFT_481323 [Lophiotrema nucula]|uniref:Thioredoxin domain-containing protein n=1 Tax=Lophiotrema nucula TaxID=690887 RepID=A0A6A5ZSD2_9PLEO|nr:hypothetical protein BDV96DRAFT_481323 [Lophiotrema nucula]
MTIKDNFEVPKSAQELPLPDEPNARFFVLYLSSIDPATNQPWCGDVRRTLPLLNKTFSADPSPEIHYAYVGSRYEYKEVPGSRFRTDWDITRVPTLARYERVNGQVKEVGRLVEGELLDEKRIGGLIGA